LDKDPTPILGALALLQNDEAPTIGYLLGRLPELARCDWINRWGPIDAWSPVLSIFSTPQLEYLAKALTILERDLKWLGGSVAATIWVFRTYRERDDGDVDALASWIVDNGCNPWSPWGSQCDARTLSEFRRHQETKKAARLARIEFEEQQRQRKKENKRLAQAAAALRRAEGIERAERVRVYVRDLASMGAHDRLLFLARDRSFPLEVIPQNLINSALPQVQQLTAEIRAVLRLRLDRRKARRWRKLRNELTE
jgi:hypothetical protein